MTKVDNNSFILNGIKWNIGDTLYLLNIEDLSKGFIESKINSMAYIEDTDWQGLVCHKYYSIRFDFKYDIYNVTRYLKDELICMDIKNERSALEKDIHIKINQDDIHFGYFFIATTKEAIIERIKDKYLNNIQYESNKINILKSEIADKEKLIGSYEDIINNVNKIEIT